MYNASKEAKHLPDWKKSLPTAEQDQKKALPIEHSVSSLHIPFRDHHCPSDKSQVLRHAGCACLCTTAPRSLVSGSHRALQLETWFLKNKQKSSKLSIKWQILASNTRLKLSLGSTPTQRSTVILQDIATRDWVWPGGCPKLFQGQKW